VSNAPYKALVTGGAGFIGSALVDRLLAEGHAVDAVDNLSSGSLSNLSEARTTGSGRFRFHQLDIRSTEVVELMARRKPDVVFHLAAAGAPAGGPVLDAEVSVVGSVRVLEGARAAGSRKVVFASSYSLYGNAASFPVRESEPLLPVLAEAVAKKAVGDYLRAYRATYGLEYTTLALANVYGPRQLPQGDSGVVAVFAGRLLGSKPCLVYGDGRQTRDFVFVDDAVDAFSRAGQRGSGLLCNVGTSTETSINELYATMARHVGVAAAPIYGPGRAGDVRRSSLDPGRAYIHLGWKPWTTVEKGTALVLDWARGYRRGA